MSNCVLNIRAMSINARLINMYGLDTLKEHSRSTSRECPGAPNRSFGKIAKRSFDQYEGSSSPIFHSQIG